MPTSKLSAPIFVSALMSLCFPFATQASIIDFEGSAVPAEFEFLFAYQHEGFSFGSSSGFNAVVASGGGILGEMIGSGSDFLRAWDSAQVSMFHEDGVFNLESLLVGPTSGGLVGGEPTASGTIIGEFAAGGSSIINYSDLTTATILSPDWSNLTRVIFAAEDSFGIDDIVANVDGVIPLPPSLALLGLGLFGLGYSLRFRKGQRQES